MLQVRVNVGIQTIVYIFLGLNEAETYKSSLGEMAAIKN
jgi:hypothetical protein